MHTYLSVLARWSRSSGPRKGRRTGAMSHLSAGCVKASSSLRPQAHPVLIVLFLLGPGFLSATGCASTLPPGVALLSASLQSEVWVTGEQIDGTDTSRRQVQLEPGDHTVAIHLLAESIDRDLVVSDEARCEVKTQRRRRGGGEGRIEMDSPPPGIPVLIR